MSTQRKLNFNAGPGALPEEVLREASEAVIEYNNSGISILELQHRSAAFDDIMNESRALVKELCNLGNDYEVLWLHGGGRLQFCMVPMNLLGNNDTAGYIESGYWAQEAMEYAGYYGKAKVLSSSKGDKYTHLPEWPTDIPKDLAYVHYTTNNTIYGTQMRNTPTCPVPLVADMSSDLYYGPRDYAQHGLFYAAAQKNIGAAGVTLVAIRKDMLQRNHRALPPMLSYDAQVAQNSVLNTSPVFAIYVSLLMLRWTKQKGLANIEAENIRKAQLMYDEIDRNSLFVPIVTKKEDRSLMNACFTIKDAALEQPFLRFCEANNIVGIKGHRAVGGFRASLYNSVKPEHVQQLVAAMQAFENNPAI